MRSRRVQPCGWPLLHQPHLFLFLACSCGLALWHSGTRNSTNAIGHMCGVAVGSRLLLRGQHVAQHALLPVSSPKGAVTSLVTGYSCDLLSSSSRCTREFQYGQKNASPLYVCLLSLPFSRSLSCVTAELNLSTGVWSVSRNRMMVHSIQRPPASWPTICCCSLCK